ncbi:hypothetical protein M495_09655 [Serratia liquefaciens ATCC 27592]|nr:hypothetical protein M495_09655 [Serratia liquefaciens ATCC 27592]
MTERFLLVTGISNAIDTSIDGEPGQSPFNDQQAKISDNFSQRRVM